MLKQSEKFNFLNCPQCSENFYYLESDVKNITEYLKCPNSICNEILYLGEGNLSIESESKKIVQNQIPKGRSHEFKNPDFFVDLNNSIAFKINKNENSFMKNMKLISNTLYKIYQVPFQNDHMAKGNNSGDKGNLFYLDFYFRKTF